MGILGRAALAAAVVAHACNKGEQREEKGAASQAGGALFRKNARLKTVELRALPSGASTTATLADFMDWQEITLDQPAGRIEAIELHARDVYEGLTARTRRPAACAAADAARARRPRPARRAV